MTGLFFSLIQGLRDYVWPILAGAALCFALELFWPRTKPSAIARLRGAGFMLLNSLFGMALLIQYNALMAHWHVRPLLLIDLGDLGRSDHLLLCLVGWIGAPVAAAVVGEFFYYWMHRWQHSNAFLWRFHAVHHSIRDLNAWSNYSHFMEAIFRIPFVVLPTTFLIAVDSGYVPPAVAFLLTMQGTYAHSCTKVHLGPLRYLIVDNHFHRAHHAIDGVGATNFGNFTSLWDILFGTAGFPKAGEWPETGLVDVEEPKSVSQFLFAPFKRKTT